MNPRTELEARYPSADFSVYFRELFARCTTKRWNTQEHHICPKKQFPEFIDAPENLITLAVDDHDYVHKLLEAACGIKAPSTLFFEKQRDSASKGGKVGGKTQGKNNVEGGHLARQRALRTSASRSAVGRRTGLVCKERRSGIFSLTYEQRQAAGQKGGSAVAAQHRRNGTGIFSFENRRKGGLAGTHKRWHVDRGIKVQTCSLCTTS